MMRWESIQKSLPDDIALKIASLLQVGDLCALGSCSRFWRELCRSECLWESLTRERWPLLGFSGDCSSSSTSIQSPFQGWRSFYIRNHNEMASRAMEVVKFVEESSLSESLEVGDYLRTITDLHAMQFGFKDVELLLLKPKLNALLNLIGIHYCINCLGVPAEDIVEALEQSKISDRQVCVKWWKLGRWFYGFRMKDEARSRWVALVDMALAKEEEVLAVLHRGAIHEVLRVQISLADPYCPSWISQSYY
ncbi:hypothetical protein UlMin_009503 [Ulmus minor]